jgi:hypothetical protein
MSAIILPPDLEERLAEEAHRRGTTAELLALDSLRRLFVPPTADSGPPAAQTLWDFLSSHIGTVNGSVEPLSDECGQRFAEGLAKKRLSR